MKNTRNLIALVAAAGLLAACAPSTETPSDPGPPTVSVTGEEPTTTSPEPSDKPTTEPTTEPTSKPTSEDTTDAVTPEIPWIPDEELTDKDDVLESPDFLTGGSGDLKIAAANLEKINDFYVLVLQLGSPGTPAFHIQYVDQPVGHGHGEPIEVSGKHFLQATLSGFEFPDINDKFSNLELRAEDIHVVFDGWFEGQYVIYIGLDDREDFTARPSTSGSAFLIYVED